MDRPCIKKLRISNFGPIRSAEFELTPLHALIGPNDAGKSTVLQVLDYLGIITDVTHRRISEENNQSNGHSTGIFERLLAEIRERLPEFAVELSNSRAPRRCRRGTTASSRPR